MYSGSLSVSSYDPNDGSRIWTIDGPTEQFVPSLVEDGELVFVTSGCPEKHLVAIRPDGTGNVTETNIVWRDKGPNCSYVPSPIVVGDYFLMVADSGILSCYETKTGKQVWRERIGPKFHASLVTAGGLVYCLSDRGGTTIVKPGPTFEKLAENTLDEECYASPAISQGQLFIRGERHLYCIGTLEAPAARR
jgi:outer membrane protein assembly factor BamB